MKHKRTIILILSLLFVFNNVFSENDTQEGNPVLDLSIESDDIDIYTVYDGQYKRRSYIKKVIFHDSLLLIGVSAFQWCDGLTDLVIPDRCEDIQDKAFYGCKSLKSVKLSSSLKVIGEEAFRECESLTDLVIPYGCKYILDGAFFGCKSLKTITIPPSVVYIEKGSIPMETKLIVAKKSVAEEYAIAMGMSYTYDRNQKNDSGTLKYETALDLTGKKIEEIDDYQYNGRREIRSLKLPNSLKKIGRSAFKNCASVTDIVIPNSCDTILDEAFAGCSSLRTVKLPSSLKTIGPRSFENCNSLVSVTIPNGCKEIQDEAFSRCVSLQTVQIPASVKDIGTNMYVHCFPTDVLLIVERGSYAERYAQKMQYSYVYSRDQIKNSIGPILKTHWNQPLDYFYSPEKYGFGEYYEWDPEDGICYIISYAQIFYHLGLKVSGARSYATSDHVYYKDFDENKVNMKQLPAYFGHNSYENTELIEYIENLAIACEHPWRKEHQRDEISTSLEEHVPFQYKGYPVNWKNKVEIENLIRKKLEKNIPLYAGLKDFHHAVVIDGIRVRNGETEVHLNFGWGGRDNRWTPLLKNVTFRSEKTKGNLIINPETWELEEMKTDISMKFSGVEYIYEILPLNEKEMKEWKPYRLTSEQKSAIEKEKRHTAEMSNDTLYIPEGTNVIQKYNHKFVENHSIKHISLPSTLRVLDFRFINVTNVEELYIPPQVEKIYPSVLEKMKNLKKVYCKKDSYAYQWATDNHLNIEIVP
ncbi:MAG: leucine-rich repeat protein [Paludibacteraceae bacterium]|nr:leucine-rich repeat protein [Paludibacteraceae bacterium]